jgi:hypothetical protein
LDFLQGAAGHLQPNFLFFSPGTIRTVFVVWNHGHLKDVPVALQNDGGPAKKTQTKLFFAAYPPSDHHIFDEGVDLRITIQMSE